MRATKRRERDVRISYKYEIRAIYFHQHTPCELHAREDFTSEDIIILPPCAETKTNDGMVGGFAEGKQSRGLEKYIALIQIADR